MTEEIIERLRSLDLSDGGSHLSAIASCFYQPTFGWTGGSCEILRDLLIEILEGKDVNDDNDHAHAHGCDYGHHRCDQHQVSHDELDYERHKAVCRLREWSPDDDRRSYREFWEAVMGEKLPTVPLKGDVELDIIMRDRLIHLLGGNECNFSRVESYMDAMGGKSNPAETSNESTDHVTLATPSSEDETCPNPVRDASIIDKLDNERYKAIAGLRKVCTKLDESVWTWIEDVAIAIGAQDKQSDKYESMLPKITCRLIHLLGGDQPTLSDLFGILQDGEESENRGSESTNKMTKSAEIAKPESEDVGENRRTTDEKLNGESLIESLVKSTEELSRQGKVKFPPNEDGSIEGLKTVEETAALIEDVKRRADQSHDSSPMRQENETRITDELREFATDPLLGYASQELHVERITTIADRIDEQFERICEQQEKVLQDTIDYMTIATDLIEPRVEELTKRCEELQNELDEMTELREHDAEYALAERDELQEKCDRLKAKVEHQREQLAVYATMCDFDAIRALKRERNEHKHRADNAEGHVKSLERRLDAAHETYCALLNDAAREFRDLTEERDELRRSLRQIAERAGVPHDWDLSEYGDKKIANAVIGQLGETKQYVKSLEWVRDRRLPRIEAKRDELLAKLDDYDRTHVELPKDANGDHWHIGDESEYGEVTGILYNNARTLIEVRMGNGERAAFGASLGRKANPVTVEQVIRDLTLGKITEAQAIERIEGANG